MIGAAAVNASKRHVWVSACSYRCRCSSRLGRWPTQLLANGRALSLTPASWIPPLRHGRCTSHDEIHSNAIRLVSTNKGAVAIKKRKPRGTKGNQPTTTTHPSFNDVLHDGIQQQAQREIYRARTTKKQKKGSGQLNQQRKVLLLEPVKQRIPRPKSTEWPERAFEDSNESWNRLVDRLLDHDIYPVGFSHAGAVTGATSWFVQVEHVLRRTLPQTVARAFQLLDRWLQEERADPLDICHHPFATTSVDWVVECWKTSLDMGIDPISPEEVWKRVSLFTTMHYNGSTLSTIMDTIGLVEERSKAPFRGEALMQQSMNEFSDVIPPTIGHHCLNTATINSLMKLWWRSRLPVSPDAVDRLLKQLEDWHQRWNRIDQVPDDTTYATVLATWTAMAPLGATVHRADVLWSSLPPSYQPGYLLYSTVADALARAGHVERALSVWHIALQQLQESMGAKVAAAGVTGNFEGCHPVLSILKAYRKRLDRQPSVARMQMERFMAHMELTANKMDAMRSVLHPNAACYRVLIDAYSQLRSPYRAEGLLMHALQLHSKDGVFLAEDGSFQPLALVWNGVLEAWAQSGDAETVPRVASLVRNMEERCKSDSSCRPNTQTYNILLSCLANDRRNTAVENARIAHGFLLRMERAKDGFLCRPVNESYDIAIRAWCKAGYPDQADELLHSLCSDDRLLKQETTLVYPTSQQFVTVMYGWAKIARRRNGQHRVLERVERLLQTMHALFARGYPTKPSLTAYNIFLECLIKSDENDAPERAESFLCLLENNSQSDDCLQPDVVVFNSILTAWYRSNRRDAPAKARALFNKMKDLQTEERSVINAFTYTTLMGIYAQHMLPEKVQEMFDEMQDCAPTVKVPFSAYAILMNVWAISGKPEIAHTTVEHLLRDHMNGTLNGPSTGSTLAFNALLSGWVNSKDPDAAEKAEYCLETMCILALSGEYDIRPNLVSYSSVIKTFSQSEAHDAGHRSLQIFSRMKANYLESGDHSICPDLNVYVDLMIILASHRQGSEMKWTPSEHIQILLQEVDSIVHPSCWIEQGRLALSRMAWCVAESTFAPTEKVSILHELQRLAHQHAVKLDRPIAILFAQYLSPLRNGSPVNL
jgi:pentatricopeptide repeat protein